MKITCQACHAKYTIADEKVLGKVVKIRCKKCGATIVVNGNDSAAHAGSSRPPPPSPSFEHAAHGGQRDAWTVNVGEGDQRAMTAPEIVAAYRAGHVNDETFCWKDGMSDWLLLREIESLHAACTAPRAKAAPEAPGNDDDLPTRIQETSMMMGASRSAPAAARQAETRGTIAESNGSSEGATAAGGMAALARRTGGRAPVADLFGGAARAGGEEDVLTSAPAGTREAHEEGHRATGARNENSVLFSLTALSSKGSPLDERPTAVGEASGLIDIRQLSAQLHSHDGARRSRVEDIMNLGGGGAFNPALAAPVLSAPSLTSYPSAPQTGSGSFQSVARTRPLVKWGLGVGAFLLVAAVGVAVLTRSKEAPPSDKEMASPSAGAVAPEPVASQLPTPIAVSTPPTETVATPHETNTAPNEPVPTPPAPAKALAAGDLPKEPARLAPKEPKNSPASLPKEPAPAVAAPVADQPFNMGEAKARLAAIADGVQSCKRGDTTGTGRVVVTFAPSGQAQSANLSGAPFEGTPAGACVATRFRGARVPPFTGSPFTVSKSFRIN